MKARLLVAVAALAALLLTAPTGAGASTANRVETLTFRLNSVVTRHLAFPAEHVAVYWKGHPDARVRVGFGQSATTIDAGRDELGSARRDGVTYGTILDAAGATLVRVHSDKPIGNVTVLALADHPLQHLADLLLHKSPTPAHHLAEPPVIARANWGADESLRYNNGSERWTPTFYATQKLIVHHTDTSNTDSNPASTVRAIYYYHAVTEGWGDIGYNFLIDQQGRIYKGRNSHAPGSSADTIDGRNANGQGVTAGHALNYNAGTVGVAMLGTLDSQDATPAAKTALEDLLAWEADINNLDPHGSSTYTSPKDGRQKTFPNIAGHRDVNTTDCPGGAFYASLPQVRDAVAARLAAR